MTRSRLNFLLVLLGLSACFYPDSPLPVAGNAGTGDGFLSPDAIVSGAWVWSDNTTIVPKALKMPTFENPNAHLDEVITKDAYGWVSTQFKSDQGKAINISLILAGSGSVDVLVQPLSQPDVVLATKRIQLNANPRRVELDALNVKNVNGRVKLVIASITPKDRVLVGGLRSRISGRKDWLDVRSFGTQLDSQTGRRADYDRWGATATDVLLIGRFMDSDDETCPRLWNKRDLDSWRRDGKYIFGYVGFGEASEMEVYWCGQHPEWNYAKPSFGVVKNKLFDSWTVDQSSPEWRNALMMAVDSTVDSGYDGIYLDVFVPYWSTGYLKAIGKTTKELDAIALDLLADVRAHLTARGLPDFRIVTNGSPDDLQAVGLNSGKHFDELADGVLLESVSFSATLCDSSILNNNDCSHRDSAQWNSLRSRHLIENIGKPFHESSGKPVFILDSTTAENSDNTRQAYENTRSLGDGFVPYVAPPLYNSYRQPQIVQ